MQTLIESSANPSNAASDSSSARLKLFFQSLAKASESALLLDYDGTLAPLRVDPSKVRPWAGVTESLKEIQEAGRTRLAIITGRPAKDVASQLGMRYTPEIWGLHGAETLYPDGRLKQDELHPRDQQLLNAARSAIHERLPQVRVEEKRNAVAVHWRGNSPQSIPTTQHQALELLIPYASAKGVRLLQFDGGIELRIGRDKGDALRTILNEISAAAPVAYLGDDATDEDAFKALGSRGLSILVRRSWRPSAAQVWLQPPAQLRDFLASWIRLKRS